MAKDERFHRTLQPEVLNRRRPSSFSSCQATFDEWRNTYNLHRPHEALDLDTPVSRYSVSSCAFPETLPPVEHGPGDQVLPMCPNGCNLSLRSKQHRPWRGRTVRSDDLPVHNCATPSGSTESIGCR
ncbi:MAG: transposase [Planctomycetes bacterium]|nr:transposase [Planctomycetota bacterium]